MLKNAIVANATVPRATNQFGATTLQKSCMAKIYREHQTLASILHFTGQTA